MLAILNVAFFVLHTGLILFNVLGWAWRRTRPWSLATLLLTLFSWVVMGIGRGVGYCVLTDLHGRVRAAMGIRESADSYLVLLVRTLTGWDPPTAWVNPVAAVVFALSLALSVGLDARDRRIIRHAPRLPPT